MQRPKTESAVYAMTSPCTESGALEMLRVLESKQNVVLTL